MRGHLSYYIRLGGIRLTCMGCLPSQPIRQGSREDTVCHLSRSMECDEAFIRTGHYSDGPFIGYMRLTYPTLYVPSHH